MELIASHTDPSRTVYMGAFSEIFNLTPTNATFTETISSTDTKGVLSWTPESQDLRDKPYPVVFRVSDNLFTDDYDGNAECSKRIECFWSRK